MFKIECLGSGSSGNCYLISKNNTYFMLECGISYNKIVQELAIRNLTLSDLVFIAVSHEHKDHSLSLEKIKKVNKHIIYQSNQVHAYYDEYLYAPITVTPFEVVHDVECYGFIIQDGEDSLMFATDCESIVSSLREYNFTQMMIECNYYDLYAAKALKSNNENPKLIRQINAHMSLHTCIQTIQMCMTINLKEIYLMHLSDELSDEKIMKYLVEYNTHIKTFVCQKYGGIK